MMRGIPIPSNPLKLLRMIDWYYEEKKEDYLRTAAIITAILAENTDANSINGVKDALGKYEEAIWPKDRLHEELIEENKEKLAAMANQEFFVKEINLGR